MIDPRIGTYADDGSIVERPTQTLSGRPAQSPYPAVTRLDANHFAVHDRVAPRGFDVNAALDEMRALVAPASSRRRSIREVNSGDEPQNVSE